MNLFQLEYFVVVAEELHFARAAERLHVAQPSLSYQIRQLEEEIGVRLFNRTTRRVELTAAGQAFLERTLTALRTLQDGIEIAQRMERGEQGTLVLGYNGYIMYNLLPQLLQAFRNNHPYIRLEVREVYEPYTEQQLLTGELDAALAMLSATTPDLPVGNLVQHQFETLSLIHENMLVALPRAHPLHNQSGLHLRNLVDENFVVMDRVRKPNIYNQSLQFFTQFGGFVPKIVQEALSVEAMVGLVASGAGLALVTESMRELRPDKVVYLPLLDPQIRITFGLVWNRQHHSQLLDALINTARSLSVSS